MNSMIRSHTYLRQPNWLKSNCTNSFAHWDKKVRRGGVYLSHSLTIAIHFFVMTYVGVKCDNLTL